jgi:hypothetical protein
LPELTPPPGLGNRPGQVPDLRGDYTMTPVREALIVTWDRVCGERLRPLVPLVEAMESSRHGPNAVIPEVRVGAVRVEWGPPRSTARLREAGEPAAM